ncbi:MAG TPA: histidine kinase [Actinomycetota bacterium]|nr:histidine kinase [Actinomycetota bacterium]
MRRRLPWVIWAIAIAVEIGTLSLGIVNRSFQEDPYFLTIALVMIAGYTTIGALIASRTIGNPIGWLLMMVGVGFLLGGLTDEYLQFALPREIADAPFTLFMGWLTNWLFLFIVLPIPWILLLFPSGALPSRRWRSVAVAVTVLGGLLLLAVILSPGEIDIDAPPGVPTPLNPTGVPALRDAIDVIFTVGGFALLGLGFLTVVALVLRYRRSAGEERQQMRWFVAAVALAALLLLVAIITGWGLQGDETSPINDVVFFAFFTVLGIGFPAACAVAILRYRLYELDVVVKKTVLYAVVALLFMAAFSVFAVLVGRAVIEANPLAIVASIALGVAVWPAIRLARRVADRLVYGRRATPYEVLADFGHRVGESYASEDVLPRMAAILAGAVGATRAVVWLRIGGELRPVGLAPADAAEPGTLWLHGDDLPEVPADLAIEVRDQGALLGALAVDMPPNDPMTPSRERLVRDLASQAGLVLRNVRLIEELRASRQRLVVAQDEERRRLERNIHDGAQQQLVALTVKLRLLEQTAARDPAKAVEIAEQLQHETTTALEDLRDLARGIYPPLLADDGLPAALTAQARKAEIPVTVRADEVGRFSQDVEAAVYFSCLEALQNVTKYANASRVTISLARSDGHLVFAVADDGVGFDPAAAHRGTGLQGIADRMDALRGRLEVESAPGAGTTLSGSVPID